ncbi:MAG: M23 family metallopeptidase [Candidatus Omnitrophica bacterium]|nr:M23 family metallopeptidase [Candidatus Omnitrophota bacterium]
MAALPVYLTRSLSNLDKCFFLCPVEYENGMIVRNDSRGDGNFASRRNGGRMHNGIDLQAGIGSPVYACRSGRAGTFTQKNGMGNYIILRHAGGISTLYGHLSSVEVKDGSFVVQGQTIGKVGKTGNANHPDIAPHLHFEIKKNGKIQDPLEYLE